MKTNNTRFVTILFFATVAIFSWFSFADSNSESSQSKSIQSKDSQLINSYKFSFKQGIALNHWLSYPFKGWSYGDKKWFNQSDVQWISDQGFDHLKVYVSGRQIVNTDFSLNQERLKILDALIEWNKKEKLGTIIILSMFPDFKVDTALSVTKQEEQILTNQAKFWHALASYFSAQGDNVRFNILGFPREFTRQFPNANPYSKLNLYTKTILKEIRQTNPNRVVYLPVLDLENLKELDIPGSDRNIALQISIQNATDVFSKQFGRTIAGQHPKFPRIVFPGKVPDLSSLLDQDHWTQNYSNFVLDADYLETQIASLKKLMQRYAPEIEYYTQWSYAVGWNTRTKDGIWGLHYNAESEKDLKSIANYAKAYINASKKHQLNWAIYSYNYQSPLRYTQESLSPANKVGESSALMKSLNLKQFSYKKGVLVTHWTGAVAPGYRGQNDIAHTYGASWFDEEDVDWIAKHGFDHLQIDVDENQWFSKDNKENLSNIAVYRKAVEWANKHGLGVILLFDDFPYGEQPDPMDKEALTKRALQWKKIAETFSDIKGGLRFHSGDRWVPLASNPNQRYQSYYKAIREVDESRFFYIPIPVDVDETKVTDPYMYRPEGATFEHISKLNLDYYDENVGVSFTYFQPEIFINQKKDQELPVPFPGQIPDFTASNDESSYYNNYLAMAKRMSNKYLNIESIELDFKNVRSEIDKIAGNREVYLGRFGIGDGLDAKSTKNYIRAVKNSAEKNNMSWCIYDYESGKAIRNPEGEPNAAYFGLELN